MTQSISLTLPTSLKAALDAEIAHRMLSGAAPPRVNNAIQDALIASPSPPPFFIHERGGCFKMNVHLPKSLHPKLRAITPAHGSQAAALRAAVAWWLSLPIGVRPRGQSAKVRLHSPALPPGQ